MADHLTWSLLAQFKYSRGTCILCEAPSSEISIFRFQHVNIIVILCKDERVGAQKQSITWHPWSLNENGLVNKNSQASYWRDCYIYSRRMISFIQQMETISNILKQTAKVTHTKEIKRTKSIPLPKKLKEQNQYHSLIL